MGCISATDVTPGTVPDVATSPTSRVRWFLVALVALAIVAAACGSSGADEDASPDDASGQEVDAPATTGTLPGATSVTSAPPADGPLPTVQELEPDPDDPMNADPIAPGATRYRFAYGPITVKSGQNNIAFSDMAVPKPEVDGWITRIAPNIMRADGSIPAVDVIHLHHGVWLNTSRQDPTVPRLPERIFAAGEEKSIALIPEGYGYRYDADDNWIINYMIHNLFPAEEDIWITYDLDFIPADSPEAEGMAEMRPLWMDVDNGSVYPIFDAMKGSGTDGIFTYPADAPPEDDGHQQSEWTVDRDMVLVQTAGHLHPGGLTVDLFVRRGDEEKRIFTSEAVYYEPAGAVSWDVSMTRTDPDWAVAVKAGDVLRIETTYDTERASWYESMGIMVIASVAAEEAHDPGVDPFTGEVKITGDVGHGHLPENDNHGGEDAGLPNPAELPDGEAVDQILIEDYVYEFGDFSEGETDIPLVAPGDTITFDNTPDAPLANGIWHTITSCALPCNGATGIAYPLADAEVQFDSGQLGNAGPPTAGRLTWDTPTDLEPGTYAYFCRVHPFMRGAFRVSDG